MEYTSISKQEAQMRWHSAWTEDPVQKNVFEKF